MVIFHGYASHNQMVIDIAEYGWWIQPGWECDQPGHGLGLRPGRCEVYLGWSEGEGEDCARNGGEDQPHLPELL